MNRNNDENHPRAQLLAATKDLNVITARSESLTFDALRQSYEGIRSKYETTKMDEYEALTIRRRVAERIFVGSVTKHEPVKICMQLFRNLTGMGFEGIEHRVSTSIILIQYLIENGQLVGARKILEPLMVDTLAAERSGHVSFDPMLYETMRSMAVRCDG